MTEAQQQTIDMLSVQHKHSPWEYLGLVRPDGSYILDTQQLSYQVGAGPAMAGEILRGVVKGTVLFHNHPTYHDIPEVSDGEYTFSFGDIRFLTITGVDAMILVSGESQWSLERTPETVEPYGGFMALLGCPVWNRYLGVMNAHGVNDHIMNNDPRVREVVTAAAAPLLGMRFKRLK